MNPLDGLRAAIAAAASDLGSDGVSAPALERPPSADLGDYSTNAAMLLAPVLRRPPREVASALAERLGSGLGDAARVEVAGPGFLNFTLSDRWHREATAAVLGAGSRFGAGAPAAGQRVLPEGGYAGAYVGELAGEVAAEGAAVDDLAEVGRRATEVMRRRIAATLERFGVCFDVWFSERALRDSGKVAGTIAALRSAGHVYEREGATWLRTTSFGDDKDRVLVRSNGEPTYFAVDVAYHRDKLERGAERLVHPLGSDHHGYVPRMRAALTALGFDPSRYQAPIIQFVHLVEGSDRVQMSKRTGDLITLDELVDDIGVDAARFLMLQRSHDRTVDLDLELARRQSQDNPVYYVQYAHARIASILRRAGASEAAISSATLAPGAVEAGADPAERALVRRLLELPGEVALCAERLVPHRLCAYATATAADFHAFYRDCRVIGAGEGLEEARLGLCVAARQTIATTLGLLGVRAPERM